MAEEPRSITIVIRRTEGGGIDYKIDFNPDDDPVLHTVCVSVTERYLDEINQFLNNLTPEDIPALKENADDLEDDGVTTPYYSALKELVQQKQDNENRERPVYFG